MPDRLRLVVTSLSLCLVTVSPAACSPSTGSSAEESPPVRASASPPETVEVQEADLYRAREVAGVVEQRVERRTRSTWTGTFARARGIRKGSTVGKGVVVGTVRTCATTPLIPTPTGELTGPAGSAPPCRVQWHAVHAPVAGRITALAGAEVAEGDDVVRIRPPGYVIRATVTDPAAVYDLMRPPPTGRTRILGGPAGFAVRYERRSYDPTDGSVALILAVPKAVTVVEGLRTSTAFVVSRRTSVPTLPVTAVQGTAGAGQVVVVDGAHLAVTPVRLGQHDGSRIEVTGLPAAARVLRYPLASDFLGAP